MLTVGVWTLLSRVMGFVRDILIAGYLGAGPVAQAFLIAFSLPNMFRRFFAEGAFNMAFVPMFSKKLEGGDDPETFAQDAFAGMAFLLTGFTVLGIIAMPLLVTAMASGFRGDARFDLAVTYGNLAFPYILFISLAALLSGVLNATGRFVAAAAAPVLLNIIFVAAMLSTAALAPRFFAQTSQENVIGLTLAWAVPIAGLAQLALVWIAARRAGFSMALRRPRMTPDLKKLLIIAGPAALAGGVVQINLLIGRQVASYFDGAVAWLNYADRLYQLPLGVVAIAIGVVLLPDLSRKLQAGDTAGGQDAFNRATELSLALTIPASVALIAIPLPLISVLFQRGAFTFTDAQATAWAVAIYGAGLPAFVLQKTLQPLYFARGDTKTPFYFALASLAINTVIAIGLAPLIGFTAAAWGTTLAGWGMAALLWWGTRNMGMATQFNAQTRTRLPRIITAALLMGAALYGGSVLLNAALYDSAWRILALAGLCVFGILSYGGIGQSIGAFRLQDFKAALRR
nr:murein biosynthesis integral membrane protein MurJ [Nereida sp. MMG025]